MMCYSFFLFFQFVQQSFALKIDSNYFSSILGLTDQDDAPILDEDLALFVNQMDLEMENLIERLQLENDPFQGWSLDLKCNNISRNVSAASKHPVFSPMLWLASEIDIPDESLITCFDNGEFEVVISAYVSTSFSPVSIELHEIDNNGFSFNRDVVVEYAGDVYNLKGDASRMNITLPAKQGTHVFRATVKGVSWTDAFRLAFSPSLQPTIGQAPNFPIVKIPCHITYEQLLTTQPNQINYDTLREFIDNNTIPDQLPDATIWLQFLSLYERNSLVVYECPGNCPAMVDASSSSEVFGRSGCYSHESLVCMSTIHSGLSNGKWHPRYTFSQTKIYDPELGNMNVGNNEIVAEELAPDSTLGQLSLYQCFDPKIARGFYQSFPLIPTHIKGSVSGGLSVGYEELNETTQSKKLNFDCTEPTLSTFEYSDVALPDPSVFMFFSDREKFDTSKFETEFDVRSCIEIEKSTPRNVYELISYGDSRSDTPQFRSISCGTTGTDVLSGTSPFVICPPGCTDISSNYQEVPPKYFSAKEPICQYAGSGSLYSKRGQALKVVVLPWLESGNISVAPFNNTDNQTYHQGPWVDYELSTSLSDELVKIFNQMKTTFYPPNKLNITQQDLWLLKARGAHDLSEILKQKQQLIDSLRRKLTTKMSKPDVNNYPLQLCESLKSKNILTNISLRNDVFFKHFLFRGFGTQRLPSIEKSLDLGDIVPVYIGTSTTGEWYASLTTSNVLLDIMVIEFIPPITSNWKSDLVIDVLKFSFLNSETLTIYENNQLLKSVTLRGNAIKLVIAMKDSSLFFEVNDYGSEHIKSSISSKKGLKDLTLTFSADEGGGIFKINRFDVGALIWMYQILNKTEINSLFQPRKNAFTDVESTTMNGSPDLREIVIHYEEKKFTEVSSQIRESPNLLDPLVLSDIYDIGKELVSLDGQSTLNKLNHLQSWKLSNLIDFNMFIRNNVLFLKRDYSDSVDVGETGKRMLTFLLPSPINFEKNLDINFFFEGQINLPNSDDSTTTSISSSSSDIIDNIDDGYLQNGICFLDVQQTGTCYEMSTVIPNNSTLEADKQQQLIISVFKSIIWHGLEQGERKLIGVFDFLEGKDNPHDKMKMFSMAVHRNVVSINQSGMMNRKEDLFDEEKDNEEYKTKNNVLIYLTKGCGVTYHVDEKDKIK